MPTPWQHEPPAAGRPAGTNEAAGRAGRPVGAARQCVRMPQKQQQAAAVLIPAPGCYSPQLTPHTAPQPALLLPVRSHSTPAATAPSSARNSGASVPPEPISQLASLRCDAAKNRFLCFRPGTRTRAVRGLQTPRLKIRLTSRTSGRPLSIQTLSVSQS